MSFFCALKNKVAQCVFCLIIIFGFSSYQVDATSKNDRPSVKSAPAIGKSDTINSEKLIVYYFHTTNRCFSCNKIENLTRTAVVSGFPEEIKKGRIEFKLVNIETAGNEHFAQDYKLYTKSVILSRVENNKETDWKNLEKVWTLLRDDNKFIDYVKDEIRNALQG